MKDLVSEGFANVVKPYIDTKIAAVNQTLTKQDSDILNILGAKNSLPLNVSTIKALNTTGTWNDNVYTENGLTYTIQTDSKGDVTGIDVNGTALARVPFNLCNVDFETGENVYFYNSPVVNGYIYSAGDGTYERNTLDVFFRDNDKMTYIIIDTSKVVNHVVFKPMRRPSNVANADYVPYAMTNRELTEIAENIYSIPFKISGDASKVRVVNAQDYNDLDFGLVYNMGIGNNSPTQDGYNLVLTIGAPTSTSQTTARKLAQIAFDLYSSETKVYVRTNTASTWRAWKEIT